MKQLRVLTGKHAGVQINLSSRRYVISAEDEADIQLMDWRFEPMVLEIEQDDMVSIAAAPEQAGLQALQGAQFEDFAPRRIGDVVLCVGPADARWPSDLELIARLTRPKLEVPQRARSNSRVLPVAVGAALMTLALGAAVARLSHGESQVQAKAPAVPLQLQVERAIAQIPLMGLEVVPAGDGVIVRGLLQGPGDALALRQRLASFGADKVIHAYASAPEIEQTIVESLARPGLKASYRGEGVFVVSGQANGTQAVREAAERVAKDLAPLVRRIEVAAVELPPSNHAPLSAVMNSGELQYVQTRDGVKHLSVKSIDEAEVAAGQGLYR